jgi:xylulokinase
MGYAVIEGVAFGLLDGWRALGQGAAPTGVPALSLVGGGARSAEWAQLLASALGVALLTHTGSEAGGALGAARLAWLAEQGGAAGLDAALIDRVCLAPPVARRFEPDAAQRAALAPRYARFQALYGALKPLFC